MRSFARFFSGLALIVCGQFALSQNVEYIGSYGTTGNCRSVFVSGSYAHVAEDSSGLLILDISDPFNPAPIGSLETDYLANSVYVSGNYAFLAEGICPWGCTGGLEIIDVSNPAFPDSVGGYDTGWSYFVSVSGSYAYLISSGISADRIFVVDVSEPDSCLFVNSIDPNCGDNGSFDGLFVSGDFAYTSCSGDFQIWDISDPYSPDEIGYCSLGGYAKGIFVVGDYAYAATYEHGLQIIHVSDPADPIVAGTYDTPVHLLDVFVSGHYAYLAGGAAGLEIVDVSEPTNPVFAAGYDTPGNAWGVYVQDSYIYVADIYSLMILQFNPQTGIDEIGGLPRQFILKQNYPNPFNATTRIKFDIPAETNLEITISDILGRQIVTLLREQRQPGYYSLDWDAGDAPSGIYFATLTTGSRRESIRMTLLK